MIGIGILIAIVPAIAMGVGAVLTTLWILRSPMFRTQS
jgi:hypothetical protein